MLKWFGHVEGIGEGNLVIRECIGKMWRVIGERRWRHEVKELMMGRGLSERDVTVLAREDGVWVGIGRGCVSPLSLASVRDDDDEYHAACGPCGTISPTSVRDICHLQMLGRGCVVQKNI